MKIYLSNPGLICCAGKNPAEFFDTAFSGNRSGIKKVKCGLVGEDGVKEFFAGKICDDWLKPTGDKYDMRVLQILDAALEQLRPVVEKALESYSPERIAVCLGSCDNGSELSFKAHRQFFTENSFPKDYNLTVQGADYPAVFAARKFGRKGLTLAFSTACSSSASALIKAKELIESGIVDAAIAGGVDVASDTVLLGFDGLEAVSHEMTNPFSKNRSGITLGEGAAFFVVSKDDIDSTKITLAGAGESSDASHMTAPLADGTGARDAIERALKSASLSPSDIDYINLHGTGTRLNDSMEGKGVDLVFKSYKVPLSTTKPVTGHTLGAAGALELAACFLAIKNQKLPVQVWDGERDEEIPELNFVNQKNQTSHRKITCCMSNSFAFGGCNASLVIREEN